MTIVRGERWTVVGEESRTGLMGNSKWTWSQQRLIQWSADSQSVYPQSRASLSHGDNTVNTNQDPVISNNGPPPQDGAVKSHRQLLLDTAIIYPSARFISAVWRWWHGHSDKHNQGRHNRSTLHCYDSFQQAFTTTERLGRFTWTIYLYHWWTAAGFTPTSVLKINSVRGRVNPDAWSLVGFRCKIKPLRDLSLEHWRQETDDGLTSVSLVFYSKHTSPNKRGPSVNASLWYVRACRCTRHSVTSVWRTIDSL